MPYHLQLPCRPSRHSTSPLPSRSLPFLPAPPRASSPDGPSSSAPSSGLLRQLVFARFPTLLTPFCLDWACRIYPPAIFAHFHPSHPCFSKLRQLWPVCSCRQLKLVLFLSNLLYNQYFLVDLDPEFHLCATAHRNDRPLWALSDDASTPYAGVLQHARSPSLQAPVLAPRTCSGRELVASRPAASKLGFGGAMPLQAGPDNIAARR